MRRLSTQIHLTIVAVLLYFALLVAAAVSVGPGPRHEQVLTAGLAQTAAELLPSPDRPEAELRAALERLASRFGVEVTAYSRRGELLASVGRVQPFSHGMGGDSGWIDTRGRRLNIGLRLPDGRILVATRKGAGRGHLWLLVGTIALLALAVGIGARPLVHRLTRRLERLRTRVEELGKGDLAARAPVEGRDEVADLARSFNRAAERIQELVEAQRRTLAFASHELRSPLARLRVALEMLGGDERVRDGAARDIAELDALIGELLEASRLQATGAGDRAESVDLLGLVAEEAARSGTEVSGEPVVLRGDGRLLRRLVKNLLDNATRHAEGASVEAHVERTAAGARLRVADRGPGVAEGERERIFEPFYRPPGTAESGSGYGLGLALVRQIARVHGGEARCLPREGGGTVFEVDLALT